MAQIRYIVKDVDAAVAFYTTHLGFALRAAVRARRWRSSAWAT